MAATWLQLRVELLGGGDIECDPPPGRIFLVGPSHTFAQLADAIDAAFARWDLSHLHLFLLADGRQIGHPDEDEPGLIDHASLEVAGEVGPGEAFGYLFDLGDGWRHRCQVVGDRVDPPDGAPSRGGPTVVFGWGWIPDQYGRETSDEELEAG